MKKNIKEFPAAWANDALTFHFDQAVNNIIATTAENTTEYPLFPNLDNCFESIVKNLINPPGFLEGFFLMRSHAAFRAGCMLAMSGHNPETFPVLRCCLENALYALHINRNKGLDEIWLRRHDDKSAEKKVRDEFGYGNIIKTLESMDIETYKVANSLYQRAIDFGAHPNERAMSGSMKVERGEDKSYFMQDYLSGGTLIHRHALKTSAQIGLCSLLVFEKIYSKLFVSLGIVDRLRHLKEIL